MYEYIKGEVVELSATHVVLEADSGIAYNLPVSIHTGMKLKNEKRALVYTYFHVREDAQQLFGFISKDERNIFKKLISVSGVGASTAMVILSTLSPDEVRAAIVNSDVSLLKSIKGIGAKSAQRIIVDLKDKISTDSISEENLTLSNNTTKNEALSALASLGFDKKKAAKVVDNLLKTNAEAGVELLIKEALKKL